MSKSSKSIGVWYMRYDPKSAEFCVVEPDGTTHVVNESAVFQDYALNRLIAAMARALTQPGFLFAQERLMQDFEHEYLAAYKKIASMGQMTDTLAVAHPDDDAVDALAVLMKAKLAKQRKKGYGGWETPRCTQYHLSVFLRDHVDKGDPVDVANFCAFLSARGEGIAPQPPAPVRQPLIPSSPCSMTEAEFKLFKLGWLEAEAAHSITGQPQQAVNQL